MDGKPEQRAATAVLDRASREGAIRGALPVLATWFSDASWRLRAEDAVAAQDASDRLLAKAVRLRVLLALAAESEQVLDAILQRPSFRYRQELAETVGGVGGSLDVARYARRHDRRTSPRRYPVRAVARDVRTPENVLLAAGLALLQRSLSQLAADLKLSPTGPERRAIEAWRTRLRRLGGTHAMRTLAEAAQSEYAGPKAIAALRSDVGRRLQRGDVAHPRAYRQLCAWIDRLLEGYAPEPGTTPWSLYDERFDPRLFELWTLASVVESLSTALGSPPRDGLRPLWDRGGAPVAQWRTPLGEVELHFQREASAVGLPGRWRIPAADRTLRALPDMLLWVRPVAGPPSAVLVECKLRRHAPVPAPGSDTRPDLPSEEIYKVLGYFEHLREAAPLAGMLVYYAPGGAGTLELAAPHGAGPERLVVAGVDPAHGEAGGALAAVADLALTQLGGEQALRSAREAAERSARQGGDELERDAAYKQQLLTSLLLAYAAHHEEQLPAVEKLTRGWFATATWRSLDRDTRRMVLSAELYGSQELEALDHSGPLLGLCAACERELNLRCVQRLIARFADAPEVDQVGPLDGHPTLGTQIELLDRGRRCAIAEREGDEARAQALAAPMHTPEQALAVRLLARWLTERETDLAALRQLLSQLRRLNRDHRRPSAHDTVVEAETWATGRALVLGRDAILSRIVGLFPDGP